MNSIHKLDEAAFRKKRIVWLGMMMLPSLVLDAVILINAASAQSGLFDMAEIKQTLMMLLANALLFKSEGIIIYFIMKSYGKKGEIRVSPQKVVYRKKRFVGYTFYYNYRIFIEYHIAAPEKVTRRKDGSIVIVGDISIVYFMLDVKDIHSKGTKRRCVIPGYYENMDNVMKKLENLAVGQLRE